MPIIDFHCDTVAALDELGFESELRRSSLHVDLEKLKRADVLAQFFAMFVNLEKTADPHGQVLKLIDRFYQELKKNEDCLGLAVSWADAAQLRDEGKIAAFLTVEEGGALQGSLENLEKFYQLGVRLITLTWNYPNEIGHPHGYTGGAEKGLTAFGRQLVEAMNEKGVIIDVSHLSDEGFYEVAAISKKPFVASHSNARAIMEHTRNLTDGMLQTLAAAGGITGINFYHKFLAAAPLSRIADIVEHIKHIRKIAGIEVIALGSDFDGITSTLEIEDMSQMPKLLDALSLAGFSSSEIEKICWLNARRVIRDVLK